jgi:prepilin-type N-terminal cleavage/methylation domain-containing protein
MRLRRQRVGTRGSGFGIRGSGAECQVPSAESPAGLTLVEMMVAVVLLGIGMLGLAGFTIVASKQMGGASLQSTAALVVQSRLDSLASINCQALAPSGTQSGTTITSGVRERWTVADGNDIKLIDDSVTFKGRTNVLVYKSIIPCRD